MRIWGAKTKLKTSIQDTSISPLVKTPVVSGNARVIAVTSGKGGVGKTNITVNLGLSLAGMGQRVVLFDADLGLSNIDVIMGVASSRTLYDCIYGNHNIEDIVISGPNNMRIVCGGSGFMELANLDNQKRLRLIDSLSYFDRDTDFVLVDTGAGLSKNVLGFVAAAGEVILVITPEPTSLTDAYSLTKVMDNYKLHHNVMVIVNRASSESEAKKTAERFENVVRQFLNIGVTTLGYVYDDRAVSTSVKNQRPFSIGYPKIQPSRSLSNIAHFLITGEGVAHSPSLGIQSFVGRLMRLFG